MDPIERSNSPSASGTVRPIARIAGAAACWRIAVRLLTVRKLSGRAIPNR